MARKRMLSPTIWESAYDNKWSVEDLAVMIAAISSADDEGRGRVSVIFRNLGPMISEEKFTKSLKMLSSSIIIYEKIFYYLPNWEEYQSISKPQPSKIPGPKSLNKKELTKNSNGMIPEPVKEEVRNDSIPSEVSRSENSLKEINVSEVKEITHTNFNELFTLFHLTFNEDPTPQDKNQIAKLLRTTWSSFILMNRRRFIKVCADEYGKVHTK